MTEHKVKRIGARSAGYEALIARYELLVIPNWHRSFVAISGSGRINAISDIVDMSDLKIDLFIRFCTQNMGRLSARKRNSHFEFLSDQELTQLEQVVRSVYDSNKLLDQSLRS